LYTSFRKWVIVLLQNFLFVCSLLCFLRWVLLCTPDWHWTCQMPQLASISRFCCLCLTSAVITGACHHSKLYIEFLKFQYSKQVLTYKITFIIINVKLEEVKARIAENLNILLKIQLQILSIFKHIILIVFKWSNSRQNNYFWDYGSLEINWDLVI
jgi:hypothetical protein